MRSCIILCGGRSRRMGQDKGLMSLDGKPLIIHVLETIVGLVDEIILVCRDQKQLKRYQRCLEVHNISTKQKNDHINHIQLVADLKKNHGPLMGLLTGLSRLQGYGALVLPCDSPFISQYFIKKIFDLSEDTKFQAVVPIWSDGSLEPLHSYYLSECNSIIQELLKKGLRDLKSLLENLDVKYVEVKVLDPDKLSFTNLNRPDDFLN